MQKAVLYRSEGSDMLSRLSKPETPPILFSTTYHFPIIAMEQFQDAVIGTVLTTLHAGSVLLTFYPNFNLSLQDPNLPTTLKVQVQEDLPITGFNSDGFPVYPAKQNGHFLWDVPGSGHCDPDCPVFFFQRLQTKKISKMPRSFQNLI